MLKVVFMGTPDFAVPVLKGLIENYEVIGVVSQPDKPVGRKGIMTPPPIAKVALENNIKLFQPIKIRNEYEDILALEPDIIITCAYGQIIPKAILDYPKYGCINVHASLLPKLRGGAPIHHAIIDGYDKTGITIMYMDEKMDNGDIISQEEIKIEDSFTTEILHDKLSIMGRNLLLKTLPSIISGNINAIKQNQDEVTFGYNISKEDEKIDFNKTSREVFNQVRGLNSWPVGYTLINGKRMKIYSVIVSNNNSDKLPGQITNIYKNGIGVKTGDGEVIITELQMEGKNKAIASTMVNNLDKNIIGLKLGE